MRCDCARMGGLGRRKASISLCNGHILMVKSDR